MSAWARFDFRLTYISVTINLQKPNWIFKDDLLTPCARKCLHFHNQALKAILHCEGGDITYREHAGRYKYLFFFSECAEARDDNAPLERERLK